MRCGALNGTVVVIIKPRLLIEHDLGDGLHLPGNADVSLDRDDAACNRDVAKLVPEAVGNDSFVVPEDNLVNELLGAELPCMLKDKGPALVREPSIILVIYEVIVQDVESNINGDAAQIIVIRKARSWFGMMTLTPVRVISMENAETVAILSTR